MELLYAGAGAASAVVRLTFAQLRTLAAGGPGRAGVHVVDIAQDPSRARSGGAEGVPLAAEGAGVAAGAAPSAPDGGPARQGGSGIRVRREVRLFAAPGERAGSPRLVTDSERRAAAVQRELVAALAMRKDEQWCRAVGWRRRGTCAGVRRAGLLPAGRDAGPPVPLAALPGRGRRAGAQALAQG